MRTNKAPMTDICTLVKVTRTYDESRHYTEQRQGKEVFCSVCDGVNRVEYYEALKAGIQLSAAFEVNEGDLKGRRSCATGAYFTRLSGAIRPGTAHWS